MWLAICLLFPELWDEFNGKCPSAEVFQSKYDGKDTFYAVFIEKLHLDKIEANTTNIYMKQSFQLQSKIFNDKFMSGIPMGSINYAICYKLIYGDYS